MLLCPRAQYPLPLSPHFTATQVNLDLGLAKMAKASQHWKEVGMTTAMEHKEHLQELSLKPLEIIAPWSSWDGPGSQSLPPYQHTWRAFQIHCSRLQKPWEGKSRQLLSGPGMHC